MKGKATEFTDQLRYKETMDGLLEEKIGAANSLDIIRKPFIAFAENNTRNGILQNQLDANPERR